MKLRTSIIKTLAAFMLALCLAMPFALSAVSAAVMAAHTHICHDEEHKGGCVDVRECCIICQKFGGVKNRIQNLYGIAVSKLSAPPVSAPMSFAADFSCLHTSSATLISLKVRLNN